MKGKQWMISLFILMVGVQLFVPASMIWSKEDIIKQGVAYKFLIEPIDPNDPFRGKYIIINVKETSVEQNIDNQVNWFPGQTAYATLGLDNQGFAIPISLSEKLPQDDVDYIKVDINYVNPNYISINYPFDRFYMDEDKAYEAEELYFESLVDTSSVTYAVVRVHEGDVVLEDVKINDESISDLVDASKTSY